MIREFAPLTIYALSYVVETDMRETKKKINKKVSKAKQTNILNKHRTPELTSTASEAVPDIYTVVQLSLNRLKREIQKKQLNWHQIVQFGLRNKKVE